MIKLLQYYGKKRAYIVGIISVILVLLAVIIFRNGYLVTRYPNGSPQNYPGNAPIGPYSILACILATIVPLFEFNFKMRKVSIDEYYSFPIKREKLYITKFIVGFLEVLIPMTVFFLYTLLDILLSEHLFDVSKYVEFYFLSIPTIAAVYAIVSFIYAKCNSTHDGLINVFLIQFVFVFISAIIFEIIDVRYGDPSYFFIYSPMTRLSVYYDLYMLKELPLSKYDLGTATVTIISGILFFVLGIISTILLVFLSKREKSENSMDISNSWFSYKTIIPIYIVTLTTIGVDGGAESIYLILIGIVTYIVYAVYRRNFKIKLCDIITIISCIVGGIILGTII